MRALIPVPSDDVDLHAFYRYEWLDRGGIRANMISSLDGAAAAAGLSEGLQTPGDNKIFGVLRDLADVVLVGAGTATAEKYRPIKLSEKRADIRRVHGLRAELPTAIISRSLHVDPTNPLFTDPPEGAPTIVLTCEAGDEAVRTSLAAVADVVICGDDEVDLTVARDALHDRGLTRVLCEGGPSLLASVTTVGLLTELCLSISPKLLGPGGIRIVAGEPWPAPQDGFTLVGLLEEDDALFVRMRAVAK